LKVSVRNYKFGNRPLKEGWARHQEISPQASFNRRGRAQPPLLQKEGIFEAQKILSEKQEMRTAVPAPESYGTVYAVPIVSVLMMDRSILYASEYSVGRPRIRCSPKLLA